MNIDLFRPTADLQLDLREPWPFADSTVSYVYSEHVFEHFEFHTEVPHFLAEALRVLEPGGVFDVVVPDTEEPLKAYGHPTATYWATLAKRWHPEWVRPSLTISTTTSARTESISMLGDSETLARSLTRAGFQSVGQREFNLEMDSKQKRARLALYDWKETAVIIDKDSIRSRQFELGDNALRFLYRC